LASDFGANLSNQYDWIKKTVACIPVDESYGLMGGIPCQDLQSKSERKHK